MAHHHLVGLAYADYFAAGGDGGATVVVPEVDAGGDGGDRHHIYYGVHHQHRAEAFVPADAAEMAAHGGGKAAALGGHHFVDLCEHHRHQLGRHRATTLTSLSLHGPAAEAASSPLVVHQHQLGGGAHQHQQQGVWHLMCGSRFLLPTQQLLQEFCSLPAETTTTSPAAASNKPTTTTKNPGNEEGGGGGGPASSAAPVSARIEAMDAAELHRLKAKLHTMLDEVDRRYRRYREQMRAVAGSFEAVAGAQAAAAYTRLASRTISRHFRALRDGVAAQVEAVRGALGEKDDDVAGVPRAAKPPETTPRLRVLDQCLRQNRAFQVGALESQPWRPQRGLPERAVSILRAWLFEHFLHPYPSDVEKHILARQTGLSRSQVSNWFINARVRLWKPMVEEMYAEEMKDPHQADEGSCSNNNVKSNEPNKGHGRGGADDGELKPTQAQLMVHDAGSLASVVSIGSGRGQQQQNLMNFGVMDHLGFVGAYDGHHAAADSGHGFGGGGGGVSLTLGLHQQHHADPHGGINIAFAAAASSSAEAHEFLFMGGGGEQQQMDDVAGGVVYSVGGGHHHGHHFGGASMEGDSAGMTALKTNYHLLHDLAG